MRLEFKLQQTNCRKKDWKKPECKVKPNGVSDAACDGHRLGVNVWAWSMQRMEATATTTAPSEPVAAGGHKRTCLHQDEVHLLVPLSGLMVEEACGMGFAHCIKLAQPGLIHTWPAQLSLNQPSWGKPVAAVQVLAPTA